LKTKFLFPGVKFRRQHWLFLLICLLMFIIVLSIYLPIASRASSLEDPDYRMRVVSQLLRETPLIDGWVETILLFGLETLFQAQRPAVEHPTVRPQQDQDGQF
jgi:hypothetical protein